MARLYADEQFPLPVVEFLRSLGWGGNIWEGGSDRFYSLLHGIAVSGILF